MLFDYGVVFDVGIGFFCIWDFFMGFELYVFMLYVYFDYSFGFIFVFDVMYECFVEYVFVYGEK